MKKYLELSGLILAGLVALPMQSSAAEEVNIYSYR